MYSEAVFGDPLPDDYSFINEKKHMNTVFDLIQKVQK
jgi:hypothetical protein